MKLGDMNLTVKDMPKVMLFVAGYVAMITLLVRVVSLIVIVLISLLFFSMIVWVVSQKLQRRACQRVFKYMVIVMFISIISFSAFQNYLYWNAGYPSTFDPSQPDITVSHVNMLDVSLVEIVQEVKNTSAFSLLSLEYPSNNILKSVNIDTRFSGGSIEVRFNNPASKVDFYFQAHDGRPYTVWSRSVSWSKIDLSQIQQPQTADKCLQQIDDLGLQWFYDHAIEAYQNKTGITPEITGMSIFVTWNYETYQEMMLSMNCLYEHNGTKQQFNAVFYPDGTLYSLK